MWASARRPVAAPVPWVVTKEAAGKTRKKNDQSGEFSRGLLTDIPTAWCSLNHMAPLQLQGQIL